MNWQVRVAKRVQRALARMPADDQRRLLAALEEMRSNPFSGDIAHLRNQAATWRRRVGSYRNFYDVYPEQRVVDVVEVVRRTSTTY